MWHVWGREIRTGFWWGNLKEGERTLGGRDIDGRIYKMVLKEIECEGVEWINLT